MGQTLDQFYLVYWGLLSIARTYVAEGQTQKALDISKALKRCPVEFRKIEEEFDCLLADLQASLPTDQFEAAMKQVEGTLSADEAKAAALAYALEHEAG